MEDVDLVPPYDHVPRLMVETLAFVRPKVIFFIIIPYLWNLKIKVKIVNFRIDYEQSKNENSGSGTLWDELGYRHIFFGNNRKPIRF
tara:strand:- start:115 stop:375 length:261 start_codon:yes stop_codon:yes gene_type:complete